MTAIRLESFFLLLILGFFCVANSNPITSLFGKSSDDKAETDDKAAITTAPAAKTGEITTTTTPGPSSSCGGLKGFLHICDKTEATEPPKNIKTRSVTDDDDSDSSSDSDSEESNESPKPTENSTTVSETTEGKISKRQVGDPEAPVLGEIPLVVEDAMEVSEESSEEEKEEKEKEEEEEKKKREVDDSDSSSDSDEDETKETRQRRDCRDKDGDNDKDCRKKRELVPSTALNQTTPKTEA